MELVSSSISHAWNELKILIKLYFMLLYVYVIQIEIMLITIVTKIEYECAPNDDYRHQAIINLNHSWNVWSVNPKRYNEQMSYRLFWSLIRDYVFLKVDESVRMATNWIYKQYQ